MRMGPSRRDQYVSWIVGIKFCNKDHEASEGVVAAPRSEGGNMRLRGHNAYQLSLLI